MGRGGGSADGTAAAAGQKAGGWPVAYCERDGSIARAEKLGFCALLLRRLPLDAAEEEEEEEAEAEAEARGRVGACESEGGRELGNGGGIGSDAAADTGGRGRGRPAGVSGGNGASGSACERPRSLRAAGALPSATAPSLLGTAEDRPRRAYLACGFDSLALTAAALGTRLRLPLPPTTSEAAAEAEAEAVAGGFLRPVGCVGGGGWCGEPAPSAASGSGSGAKSSSARSERDSKVPPASRRDSAIAATDASSSKSDPSPALNSVYCLRPDTHINTPHNTPTHGPKKKKA